MIEGLVEKLLLSYFGDYIDNLDKNKLKVGVCTYTNIYIITYNNNTYSYGQVV